MKKEVGGRGIPGPTVGVKTQRPPTRSKLPVLRPLCHLIPPHLVAQLARDLGAEKLARTFSHWRQVVALLYAQLTHAISLNEVCDSRRRHSGPLSALRGATPPSKNDLAHANKERDPALAEALFWKMLAHRRGLCPALGGRAGRRWAGLRAGEIVRFDRAYVDFAQLLDLTRRGVFWVTRAALWLRLDLRKLGDSRRELPAAGRAGAGVFAGHKMRLWDSRRRGNAARTVAS